MREQHQVRFVGEDELPEDVDWMIARDDEQTFCFIKQGRITPDVLMEAWDGYRKLVQVPRQRMASVS